MLSVRHALFRHPPAPGLDSVKALALAAALSLVLLCPPPARAGSYTASYSGGTVQSQGGNVLPSSYSLNASTGTYGDGGPEFSYSPSSTASVICSGPITATFTGSPPTPASRPPPRSSSRRT